MSRSLIAFICGSSQVLRYLANGLGGQTMTSIESHCTRPSGLVNLWPARSPGFVPGDLAKASIVHIAYTDAITSITSSAGVLACVQPIPPQNSLLKKNFCKIVFGRSTYKYKANRINLLVLYSNKPLGICSMRPNNEKHRFTLHETFGSNEPITSKVTWLQAGWLNNY